MAISRGDGKNTDMALYRRVALVLILLAVVAAGLQARGAFSHVANAAAEAASGTALSIALATAEGIALVAIIIVFAMARPHRVVQDDEEKEYVDIFPWWAKFIGFLLALVVLAVPLYLLLTKGRRRTVAAPPAAVSPRVRITGPENPVAQSSDLVPILVGVGLALAALLVVALYSRRRFRGNAGRDNPARRAGGLADALAAAGGALTTATDPRQAIIACYAALEHGFAVAGSAPVPADTPAEVLARAASAGLVRSGSAELLTGLFRRARYSAQPMTPADSGAAASALARMREDLLNP
jgi:hypothetical protein